MTSEAPEAVLLASLAIDERSFPSQLVNVLKKRDRHMREVVLSQQRALRCQMSCVLEYFAGKKAEEGIDYEEHCVNAVSEV